jgi:hypothetical protein
MRTVIAVLAAACLAFAACGSSASKPHAPTVTEMQSVSDAVSDIQTQCSTAATIDPAALGADVQRIVDVLKAAQLDASVKLNAGTPGEGRATTLREIGGRVADYLASCNQDGLAGKLRSRLSS